MGWIEIPLKNNNRVTKPKVRIRKGVLSLNVGAYRLLSKDSEAKSIYISVLHNDSSKADYIVQSSKEDAKAIRVGKSSKTSSANMLQAYITKHYGSTEDFLLEEPPIKISQNRFAYRLVPQSKTEK